MHLKEKGWIKHWDFILVDLVCLNITFLCAYWIRLGFENMYANRNYRMLLMIAMILHFSIMFFSNCYSGILRRGYFDEFRRVVVYNVELIGFMFAYIFVMQLGSTFARTILVGFFLLNTVTMYLLHIVMKKVYHLRGINGVKKKKLLIMTDENKIEGVLQRLEDGPNKDYNIIGIVLTEKTDRKHIQGIPVVCIGEEAYEYACRNVVDDILLSLDVRETGSIESIANVFLQMGIPVHIEINIFEKRLPNAVFGSINEVDMVTTSVKTITTSQLFIKRVIDICAGVVGCLITAVLFLFVAPAIKIADPNGPVFFGQTRVGKNGRRFKIYKFRSMYSDAEERKKELMEKNKMDGLMFKVDCDPRVIGSGPDGSEKGLGHFLRSSSIDEFPNFWSILKGDMSLVGTRPPTTDEYERYELHHKSRLAIKPGLTGMWQVSGRSDFTNFEEVVKLDNEYINNWSVGLDIKIVLKTVFVVLKRRGSQ